MSTASACPPALPTAAEECDLARRRDAGDRAAWRELVERNRGLVHDWVNSHARGGPEDREDAEQEGMLGLMTAAAKFDPARSCRFSTVAIPWIRQSVRRARHDRGLLVRVPVYLHEILASGRDRRDLRVGEDVKAAARKAMGLVAAGREDDGDRPRDDWGPSRAPSPPEALLAAERRARIGRAIAKLFPIEAEVVRRRFPLDGGEPEKLGVIGRDLGVSGERIRQIEAKALARLRGLLGEERAS